MANLQANLRSQFALAREEQTLFLQSVNRLFYENTVDSAYATVFFAEYDDAGAAASLYELRASFRAAAAA